MKNNKINRNLRLIWPICLQFLVIFWNVFVSARNLTVRWGGNGITLSHSMLTGV